MFKKALIAINIIAAMLAFGLLSDMRWRNPSADQLLAALLLLGVPVMNLVYTIYGQAEGRRGLLGIYLERKRLEEQMKLDAVKERSTVTK